MEDIFKGKTCSFYKNVVERDKNGVLKTPGKVVNILDVLTNERYTNQKLLNDLRNSGYKSDFYNKFKSGLSAACFSSVQDDMSVDRNDANHLFHTGFITFDIDTDANPLLLSPGGADEMKEYIIDNIPCIAYIGKSVSNLGLWGLVPILNTDEHFAHYLAMVKLFEDKQIILDKKTRDISRLRFLAYDPDAHFELNPDIFTDTLFNEETQTVLDEYERTNITDELFVGACRWVEIKHEIKFQPGSIHNYLRALYTTLRYAHVPHHKILNWVFNNLIDEDKITTNCFQEIKVKK